MNRLRLQGFEGGFSLVEAVISMALLTMVAIAATLVVTSQRSRNSDFSSTTSCYTLTSGLTSAIKAYDNALTVRNWLPRASTALSSAQVTNDPFCSVTGGRTPICDTFQLFSNLGSSVYVDPDNTKNFQNIRGAFTWAQSLYNTHRNSGICSSTGMTLTPSQMQGILPSSMGLPAWVTEYQLYIKDTSLACGQLSTSMRAVLEFRITARYRNNPAGELEGCASTISISNPNDSRRPVLTVRSVQNLDGAQIPPGACTDRRTIEDIINDGGVGTDWQTIFIDLLADEPGSILTCRKGGAFELDPAGYFRNCPDLPLIGGSFSVTPNDQTISYNVPLQARLTMAGTPPRGQEMHIYEVKATDVGGNESTLTTTSFRVHSPVCIDRDLYCPNAVLASPPSPAFQGINVRPWDDCLNGGCPQGTYTWCNPGQAGSVCENAFYNDACGIANCQGSMPLTSCAGVNLSTVPCGVTAYGPCGADCGSGQMNCSPPTPPATPPAGCDCSGVNLASLACDTFAPDSCGTVDACGPGTQNCPPATPAPWVWGPGMFRVDESSSNLTTRTYTHSAGAIPPGYSSYEVTIDVWGESDRAASRITVSATLSSGGGSQTFSQSGGPYYPIDTYRRFFGGTITVPGPGPVNLSITTSVTETFSRTFFTIRGIP